MLEFKVMDDKPVYPIEHTAEQGSEEWLIDRVGKITSSILPTLMPADGKKLDTYTEGQKTILRKVAAEILTGESSENGYKSSSMEYGSILEAVAREELSKEIGQNIRECNFFEYSPMTGGSADGIVQNALGKDCGVVEIKCPDSQTHLLYLLDNKIFWKKYRWQLLGNMFFTKLTDQGFLCSFDARMPKSKSMLVMEPQKGYRDDLKKIEERMFNCCAVIAGMIK